MNIDILTVFISALFPSAVFILSFLLLHAHAYINDDYSFLRAWPFNIFLLSQDGIEIAYLAVVAISGTTWLVVLLLVFLWPVFLPVSIIIGALVFTKKWKVLNKRLEELNNK